MANQLKRKSLAVAGHLSEPLVRSAGASLAEFLAGGERGYACDERTWAGRGHDPRGIFELVTEGRQRRWYSRGAWHIYSACEDLPGAVYLRLCGYPPVPEPDIHHAVLDWANRAEADNEWIPGWNLRRIVERAEHAWERYEPGSPWDIQPADAVQVQGRFAHTLVVTAVVRGGDGAPVEVDTAEYGQWHKPAGAKHAGPSCRVYRRKRVSCVHGRWAINGCPVLGRVSCWDIVRTVEDFVGCDELPAALVPEDWSQ